MIKTYNVDTGHLIFPGGKEILLNNPSMMKGRIEFYAHILRDLVEPSRVFGVYGCLWDTCLIFGDRKKELKETFKDVWGYF